MYARMLTGPTIFGEVEPGICNCPGNQPKPGTPTIMGDCGTGNTPKPT